MTWKPDERQRKTFGPFSMVSLQPKGGGQSAHLVEFGDGRQIRVLPDSAHSGAMRSRVLQDALETLAGLIGDIGDVRGDGGFDPVVYVRGVLAGADLEWEEISTEVTIEEWLAANWENIGTWRNLVHDLSADGWEIVRKGAP